MERYRSAGAPVVAQAGLNVLDNEPFAPANDTYSMTEDTTLTVGAATGVRVNNIVTAPIGVAAELVGGATSGTVTLAGDGSFTYTPAANFFGTAFFSYRLRDGIGVSATASVAITVANTPDAPVAANNSYAATEDTPLAPATGVLANDSDPDGDTLTAVFVAGPSHGVLTLSPSGLFTYSPDANYNGPDSFTYKANDGVLDSNVATVTISVAAVNDPPVAQGDAATTAEDTAVTIDALANDSDVEGSALKPTVVTQPAHGAAFVNAAGRIVYTPAANYYGGDSFTYKATEVAAGLSGNVATVTLSVTSVEDAPVASNNTYAADQDVTLSVAAPGVLGNDSDGDPLTAALVAGPTHGTLAFNADGSFTYAPNAGYFGPDSFTYTADDGHGAPATATVTLNVRPPNDPPAAADDAATTSEDPGFGVGVNVLANDTDPNGDALAAVVLTQPANGAAAVSPNDGWVYYTPRRNFFGTDTFTYRPFDGRAYGAPATVTVTVLPVNDAPVAVGNFYELFEDGTLTILGSGVLGNDFDVEQDPLAAVLATGPAHGTLTLNATGGFTYVPAANYNGLDSFTYRAFDGQAFSAPATVNIRVTMVNDAPVGVNDFLNATEDTSLTFVEFMLLANDSDVDSNSLRATAVTQPLHGTLTAVGGTTQFIYRAAANYNGTDTFTYRPSDGSALGNVVTVTVTVAAVNDAPVAAADGYITAEDTPITVAAPGVLANDADPDGDAITAILVTGPTSGTLAFNANGGFTFTPQANTFGSSSFRYRLTDGLLFSNPVTVTIILTPVNDPPVAAADLSGVAEDGTLTVASTEGVLANDTDIEFNALTAILVTGPAHGTLSLSASGAFTYTPDANYNGPDGFTYKASDGLLDSNVATVSLTVAAVNDAPTLAALGDLTISEDAGTQVVSLSGVTAGPPDEAQTLTVTATSDNPSLIPNPTVSYASPSAAGTLSLAPSANASGTATVTVTVSDGLLSVVRQFTVTVTPVNDPPVAVNDTGTTPEDTTVTVAVLANDSDAEGDPLAVTAVTQGAHGAVTFTAAGATYQPAANYFGPDSFTYTVSDGRGGTATATVGVTVTPVNDAPTATGLPAVTLLEDAAPTGVALTGGFADVEDGAAGLTYSVVGNTNAALFSGVTVTGGVLRLTPAANANGTAVLTVRATDAGGLSVQATLAVTVTPVNDAPSFAAGANQSVTAGTGPRTVGGWATGVSRGPADESAQGLAFVVTTTNPGLFVALPAIDPVTGNLTFIPEASATGTATVTVSLRDTGGTAGGGVDASATRTFTIAVTSNGLPTAAGVRMVGTQLVITGAATADAVSVTTVGNGKTRVVATLNGVKYSQQFAGVTRVRVDTKAGNDTIVFGDDLAVPTWTDAGAGNDTVVGTSGVDEIYLGDGDDTADAGGGNDFVAGGAGKDVIQGGAGNDSLYGGDGDDLVVGGPGVDSLFGQGGNDILVAGSAAARHTSTDSLRRVLTDWNPASAGAGGYADLRSRLAVTDDGVGDLLSGGADTDWFWFAIPVDAIDDLQPGEQLN